MKSLSFYIFFGFCKRKLRQQSCLLKKKQMVWFKRTLMMVNQKQFANELKKTGQSLVKKAQQQQKQSSFFKKGKKSSTTRLNKSAKALGQTGKFLIWIAKHAWANKWLYLTLAHLPHYYKNQRVLVMDLVRPLTNRLLTEATFGLL
jgi:hypothetical protein